MRMSVTCSWCHQANEVECGKAVYCSMCGHRADRQRVACDCVACRSINLAVAKAVTRSLES
jgi:hypothetical protein